MSRISRSRHFPVQMRWPQAGNNPSRLSRRARRSLSSLIGSQRLPRRQSPVSSLSVQIPLPRPVGVTSNIELGASIKSP
jgi:hypothetical protein